MSDTTKLPTRPAPPPPRNANGIPRPRTVADGMTKLQEQKRGNKYDFQSLSIPRSRSTSDLSQKGRKLPPPRPPPPKLPPITSSNVLEKRPQSIMIKLPGFKSRKKRSQRTKTAYTSSWHASSSTNKVKSNPLIGSLIDLQSPSITPTNYSSRYSSDDTSADSMDSDSGIPSSIENHNESSRWNGSQVESGFEDDFDRLSTPSTGDPFSPLHGKTPIGGSPLLELSNEDPRAKKPINATSVGISSRPTIIRPVNHIRSSTNNNEDTPESSPPMPSIPPPPPPPEVLELLSKGPMIPPRLQQPLNIEELENKEPHCIALYDYTPDCQQDLSFKINDRIALRRFVNEEWLEGELDGKVGMFPSSFVDVIVAPNEGGRVIALYDFHPQTWDDLQLYEGDYVRVIVRITDNWYYGECNGKRGQFPSNHVAEYPLI